jgi:hypothetical protein
VSGPKRSGRHLSRFRATLALLLAVWLGTRLAAAPQLQPVALAPMPTTAVLAQPLATAPPVAAIAVLTCDPVDQLFARMFNGLTQAAMTNAGIDRQDILDATAVDRATLKRYLEALGVVADDAQLDALMGGQLPGANLNSPFVALGSCQSLPSPSSRGK